ncbi:MAG: sugar transferase [candidate division WOR-3 bacterium]
MVKIILLLVDIIGVMTSFIIALLLRFGRILPPCQNQWSTLFFLLSVIPVIFALNNLFNHYFYAQIGRIFYRIINSYTIVLVLYIIIGFISKFNFLISSRGFIIFFFVIFLLSTLLVRIVLIPLILKLYFAKSERKTVCNYAGPDVFFDTLINFINNNPVLGLTLIRNQRGNPKPAIDASFLYSTAQDFGELYQEIKSMIIPDKPLHVISNLFNELNINWEWCKISSFPVYTFLAHNTPKVNAVLQRIVDIIVSLIFLILLSPLFLLIAFAIKIDSPGPVIYKQRRCGRDGKEFIMYKFRSMFHNNESQESRENEFKEYIAQKINKGKIIDFTQITRVGNILRRTSIDELPQFLNVLKGDMTLIGPRPPLPYEVKHYRDWHKDRLRVKPGITGLWQVYGRGSMPCDSSIFLDLIYIINRSLLLDLKLFFQTIPVVLLGKGAY